MSELSKGFWHANDKRWLLQWADSVPETAFPFDFEIRKTVNPRTLSQNNAMHLYFQMLARDLEDKNWTVSSLLELTESLGEVPWTPVLVKELIWKKIQVAMFQINSTAKLNKDHVGKVYDIVSKNMAKIAGVSTPFPDRFGELKAG